MESNKIDKILPDVIEASLYSKFLQDPKRLLMSNEEQREVLNRIEQVGKALKEKLNDKL